MTTPAPQQYMTGTFQWQHILLVLVIVLATTYRIHDLDYLSLWADELWGVLACSHGSLAAMIDNLVNFDSHPPAYQTLLYYWMVGFGKSDFSIRLPSALAGIAAIPAIYKLGKDHFSVASGLLAATLLAGSFPAIHYSQEARAYSLLIMTACIHYNFFLRIVIDASKRLPDRLGFILSATLLLYLHYAGAVVMFSEGVIFLAIFLRHPSRDYFVNGTLVFAFALLCYAPWLPVMYKHATSIATYWATKPGWPEFRRVWEFLTGFDIASLNTILSLLTITLLLLMVKAIRSTTVTQDRKTWVLFTLMLLPMAVFFGKSIFSQSIHTERHFLYALPLIVLLASLPLAVMIGWLAKIRIPEIFSVTAIMVIIASVQLHTNDQTQLYRHQHNHDFRGAVELIAKDKAFIAGPRVIIAGTDYFDHYLREMHIADKALAYFMYELHAQEIFTLIANHTGHDDFYLLDVQLTPDVNEISVAQRNLDDRYTRLCQTKLNWVRVSKYRPEHNASGQPGTQNCNP